MAKFRNVMTIFICLLSFIFITNKVEASAVSSPIIVKVASSYMQNGKTVAKPIVSGLNRSGTEVLVYFDGIFYGLATINVGPTVTDNYYYKSDKALSAGVHTVTVVARDKTSLVLSAPKSAEFTNIPGKDTGVKPVSSTTTTVKPLSAPTLIAPNEKTITAKVKPLITGLTNSGTDVLVFIDGVYNGKLSNLTDKSGTADFAYKPFLNLSRGAHSAWAVAQDLKGNKSKMSNVLHFKIEYPMPAPTLYAPVVNKNTTKTRPFIVGLTKNNSTIKIFIDRKYSGKITPANHPSGVTSFAFKPNRDLTNGEHSVYTTATDLRGKESSWSKIIGFKVITPQINQIAKEQKADVSAKGLEVKNDGNNGVKASTTKSTEVSAGLINEIKTKQNKIPVNLIIFVLFLAGVIGWIFWVNRELIKEKKEQEVGAEDLFKPESEKTDIKK